MLHCESCHGRTEQLAQTATRRWVACPTCHRVWSFDIESQTVLAVGATIAASEFAPPQVSILRGCLISGLAVASAFVVRMLLRPALGDASPFLLFTPAVAVAAFYGGVTPGVLATTLATGLGSHFFVSNLSRPTLEQWDRVILFALVGAIITASSTILRRTRRQLVESLWREQQARAIAEAADQAKDDFLALVSHELQTPTGIVLGWIATIREHRLNAEPLSNALNAVERNARVLSRLVEDILDRSRIAAGTLRLDAQLMSLNAVVRGVVEHNRMRIDSASLHLSLTMPVEELTVVGDSVRLQQVLTNLLSNATKFTPKGGNITVAVTSSDTDARVVIADTGCGITADLLPHVFEPFRRGRNTTATHGLGLGLSIARDLVERHQGTIAVESRGAGLGATFTITLPLASQYRKKDAEVSGLRLEDQRGCAALVH